MALATSVGRDEDVEPARKDGAAEDDDQGDVSNTETEDVQGIFAAFGVKSAVRETVDDGQNGTGDVLDQGAPKDGDIPVLSSTNNDVEIATQSLGLNKAHRID